MSQREYAVSYLLRSKLALGVGLETKWLINCQMRTSVPYLPPPPFPLFFCSAVGSSGQQIPPSPAQSGTRASNTEHLNTTRHRSQKSVFWCPGIFHSAPSEVRVDWMPLHLQQLLRVVCSVLHQPTKGRNGVLRQDQKTKWKHSQRLHAKWAFAHFSPLLPSTPHSPRGRP